MPAIHQIARLIKSNCTVEKPVFDKEPSARVGALSAMNIFETALLFCPTEYLVTDTPNTL